MWAFPILFIGKTIIPKAANEVKLISSGKILENNKTVGQCKLPFGDTAGGGVIIMHVVVQPSPAKSKPGKKINTECGLLMLGAITSPKVITVWFLLNRKEDRRYAKESCLFVFHIVKEKCCRLRVSASSFGDGNGISLCGIHVYKCKLVMIRL